jgi:hypothetical protein
MIEPKEITVDGKQYVLTKFPATKGREIATKYGISLLTKVSDYQANEETMLKLMAYVGVPRSSQPPLMLETQSLVDNHVKNFETLLKLEREMMVYNCGFFQDGRSWTFLEGLVRKAQPFLIKMSTLLSPLLSRMEKQPSTN